MAKTHMGGCYCGAVEIEIRGEPLEMGYCHCENCRRYSAAPVTAFTLWKPDQVKITKNEELLGKFKSSDHAIMPDTVRLGASGDMVTCESRR